MVDKVVKSDEEWREVLTPEQYRITREKGTEPPFTGEYLDLKDDGVFHCVCCDAPLFRSSEKYESGSGWPSFWEPVSDDAIAEHPDTSLSMVRTEIMCARCGAHLGHMFKDGPRPTGLRYCTNSASLRFVAREEGPEGGSDRKGGDGAGKGAA